MSAVDGYRGDAVKSKAMGTLSADVFNAHADTLALALSVHP